MMVRLKNLLYSVVVVVLCSVLMVVAVEIFFRLYDGYSFFKMPLLHEKPLIPDQKPEKKTLTEQSLWPNAAPYLDKMPLVAGTQKKWFDEDPPRLVNRTAEPDAELLNRRQATVDFGAAMGPGYVWNYYFLQENLCQPRHHREKKYFPGAEKQIYAFKPLNQSPRPTYRFLANKNYPDALVTNEFGYRGKPLAYKKSPKTIRIAFVGASTTIGMHGFPFSYPELVEHWLNLWAKSQDLHVQFEIINAARSGIASMDIAQTVTQELIHLSPDIILYYEGSNQFWPNAFIKYRLKHIFPKPTATFNVYPIENYSAFGKRLFELRRVFQFHHGQEPAKPPFTVTWPANIDEFNPDIHAEELPLKLPQILADWDTIRQASQHEGIDFIPLSFVWLVQPGMVLSEDKQTIFRHLNQSYWPYSYAWLRRMADFQNRVFAEYAQEHQLYFIDYAKYYPQDAAFFWDAIHMSYEGIRLQAWIVFQQLLPIIQTKINRGDLPRLSQQPDNIPDSLVQATSPFLVTLDEIKQDCATK